ncbi:MAG TPA: hypothetical protein VF610_13025, partial [Segetibacter sp.]
SVQVSDTTMPLWKTNAGNQKSKKRLYKGIAMQRSETFNFYSFRSFCFFVNNILIRFSQA